MAVLAMGNKADEYRRQAQACLAMAQRVSKREDRVQMMEMAQRWLDLARQTEAKDREC
jgi:hypothetical protein